MVGFPLTSTRASDYHRGWACISCLILAFPSSFGFLTSFARTVSLFFFSALLPSLASRVTLCVTLLSSLRPYLAIEIRACRAHTERGDSPHRAGASLNPLVPTVSLNRVLFAVYTTLLLSTLSSLRLSVRSFHFSLFLVSVSSFSRFSHRARYYSVLL